MGEVIGQGGFGTVKECFPLKGEDKFAVKIIHRAKLKLKDDMSIKKEVDILMGLDHRNIVKAIDFIIEPEDYYFVMEYLDGSSSIIIIIIIIIIRIILLLSLLLLLLLLLL